MNLQYILNRIKEKKCTPRHTAMKLQNTKYKEKTGHLRSHHRPTNRLATEHGNQNPTGTPSDETDHCHPLAVRPPELAFHNRSKTQHSQINGNGEFTSSRTCKKTSANPINRLRLFTTQRVEVHLS